MADIELRVPDAVFNRIRRHLGPVADSMTNKDLVEEALTQLIWAAGESVRGRFILSSERDGSDVARLRMRSLDYARGMATSSRKPKL